jgi:SAM-dependent methyltransferase
VNLTQRQQAAVDRIKKRLATGEDAIVETDCLCGDGDRERLAATDRHGIPSPTWLCRRCGMVYVSPRPDEAALKRFYNEDYFDLYASKSAEDVGELFSIQRRQGADVAAFVDGAGIGAPKVVYDIGCGTGGMLAVFADRGATVAGADYAENLVAFGNGRLGNGVLRVGGGDALADLPPADLLIASHLVEHLSDPVGWAASLRGLVRDGGLVYILTPGLRSGGTIMNGVASQFLNMHLYYFTLGTLSMVMAKAGFSLVKGSETVEAIYRKEASAPLSTGLDGDPALVDYLARAGRLRPVMAALRPLWRWKNELLKRVNG